METKVGCRQHLDSGKSSLARPLPARVSSSAALFCCTPTSHHLLPARQAADTSCLHELQPSSACLSPAQRSVVMIDMDCKFSIARLAQVQCEKWPHQSSCSLHGLGCQSGTAWCRCCGRESSRRLPSKGGEQWHCTLCNCTVAPDRHKSSFAHHE